ncbi:MAG: site-specific DNA-methyltransferase [Candidatus Sphingomonas colombiensis]|nr:site-specific DNA-methyltransferase [Sphingomonas sp.]WEK42938.1 MAG: site-specific DNA-methyltransferase [Sphingomonas sp.]
MAVEIIPGDCRDVLPTLDAGSVHCCVTSPPYFGLRDYNAANQIGLEQTPNEFIEQMVAVFREVRRVLRDDGTLWLNLGDSYAGSGKGGNPADSRHQKQRTNRGSVAPVGNSARQAAVTNATRNVRSAAIKPKDLIGIPWEVALALRADGWWLRSAIVWAKPNGMPGSQEDRCTSSYEMIFMLSKSSTYWSDFDAIKTPPRESSLIRTAQDVQSQAGSHRANGGAKTNGTMRAVGVLSGSPHGRHSLGDNVPPKERRSDKQRGHSRQHAGFNDRWDAMEKAEQVARPAMMRDVWFVSPASFTGAHYAVMPNEIARRCILAGCPEGGTVLDPFGGAGTTGLVADRLQRNAILTEINPDNVQIARDRIDADRSDMLNAMEAA